jgi:hypothetical protein
MIFLAVMLMVMGLLGGFLMRASSIWLDGPIPKECPRCHKALVKKIVKVPSSYSQLGAASLPPVERLVCPEHGEPHG